MKRIHWLLFGCIALAGCNQQAPPQRAADILATVGERTIRVADLEAEAARRAALGQAIPVKESLLEEIVSREALLARALELGLAEQPDVRRRYHNLLLAELKERELQPRLKQAKVSPEALRAAGASEARRRPAQIRLAVLRLAAPPRTSPEKLTRLAERLAEARERASSLPPHETGFGALAVDYSDDQSTRYRGGEFGWFDVGRTNYSLPAPVLAAGHRLARVGEISDVLHTGDGFFLVRLMELREAGQPANGTSEVALHHSLLAQERKRIEAEFSTEARAHARVEINTQALASVELNLAKPMARAATPNHATAMP